MWKREPASRTPFVLALTLGLWFWGVALPAEATGILVGNPSEFRFGVPGGLYATRVVDFNPLPPGDTGFGLDGSAGLFAPDDIGLGPEPDSNLSVALGSGGWIEVAFSHTVVNDHFAAGLAGEAELLLFEDGALDGASFFGRLLGSGRLVPLGSLAELMVPPDPTLPGYGPGGGDTVIGIDLDAVFFTDVELTSILIVDDAITGDSQTFELDAIANRSPGRLNPIPEPATGVLLALGLVALHAARRR